MSLELLKEIAELLKGIRDTLGEIRDAIVGPERLLTEPEEKKPPAPSVTLTVEDLGSLAEVAGVLESQTVSLPTLVSAGGTTTLRLTVEEGYVWVERSARVTSSYYGSVDPATGEFTGLVIDKVIVDGPRNVAAENVAVDEPVDVAYGKYFAKRAYAEFTFKNTSASDLTAAVKFTRMKLTAEVWDRMLESLRAAGVALFG